MMPSHPIITGRDGITIIHIGKQSCCNYSAIWQSLKAMQCKAIFSMQTRGVNIFFTFSCPGPGRRRQGGYSAATQLQLFDVILTGARYV